MAFCVQVKHSSPWDKYGFSICIISLQQNRFSAALMETIKNQIYSFYKSSQEINLPGTQMIKRGHCSRWPRSNKKRNLATSVWKQMEANEQSGRLNHLPALRFVCQTLKMHRKYALKRSPETTFLQRILFISRTQQRLSSKPLSCSSSVLVRCFHAALSVM